MTTLHHHSSKAFAKTSALEWPFCVQTARGYGGSTTIKRPSTSRLGITATYLYKLWREQTYKGHKFL